MTETLPRDLRLDRARFERTMRSYKLPLLVPTALHDTEHLPEGGALLVGNHGPFAMDTGLLVHAVHRDVGRVPRSLGDSLVFNNPYGRRFAQAFGSVEAKPENAQHLLAAGEWVLVYPGGARETMRPPEERYQLSWEGRYGFARAALSAKVPIVPVACIGLDEPFVQLATREQTLHSLPGRLMAKVLGEQYVTPLFVPRMRRTPFHYWFGKPVYPPTHVADSPQAREDAARSLQARVKSDLEALMLRGREARRNRAIRRRDALSA